MRNLGVNLDSDHATVVVTDVISDTTTRRLIWRPEACSLSTHVCQAVKNRTNKAMKRQRRVRHFRAANESEWEELGVAARPDSRADSLERATAALDSLEAIALRRRDTEVLCLLDAWRAGDLKRADIVESSGLSAAEHDNARTRIRRWAQRHMGKASF